MAKLKFYHDLRSVRPDGTAPLKINISHLRKTALLSTGVFLLPNQWDGCGRKVINHPRKERLTNLLTHLYCEAEEVVLELMKNGRLANLTAGQVKDLVAERTMPRNLPQTATQTTFLAWLDKFAASRPKPRTREIYAATINRIKEYSADAENLTFENIDTAWLAGFNKWLAQYAPSQNARNIHLRNIRAAFNNAINEEITTSYPFRKFKIKHRQTPKRSLSVETLRKLFNLEVPDFQRKYLDVFELIFFLVGINIVDLANVKSLESGRIEYYRAKTQRFYSIKVEPEAQRLLEQYKGCEYLIDIHDHCANYRDFAKRLNMNLHRIGARCGVPQLTTYWARHSWATIAASLDIPRDTIAHALGHGNNTVTDIYIDFDQHKVDVANRRVLDWVLYGKK